MNHVIIGLGGTGGKAIRALRRLIYAEFRRETPPGIGLGFLYVDSSREMMAVDDPSWKLLGTSVQLPVASQLVITGEDLQARLASVQTYPGLKGWIGDRQLWGEILGSIVGAALGGQKRRLGRFLFACKIDEFKRSLQSVVRNLQANGQTEITFHVVAGLAGGTGSGAVIDAVAQLRAMYNNPERHRILPYLLLPDQYPPANWDTGNYHANGFAALAEINALSTGAYAPIDVATGERLHLKDAFNGAYLFGNENENGYQADVDRELPGIVGEFLFQKIVVAGQVGWRSLERAENAENGDGTPETAPGARVGERSKRFLSFGIKRIAIPEEEIKEYLSLNFARQAIQQLRHNNWQDTLGFVDEARNVDVASFVRQADTLGRWSLTDDHVTLSVPILASDDGLKKWRTLAIEWENVVPTFKSMARENAPAAWPDELAKLMQKRFDEGFRNAGVATFYRTKAMARRDMAREVRGRVEHELFEDWRTGARSLAEISRALAALGDLLNERMLGVDTRLAQLAGDLDATEDRIGGIRKRWSELGLFGKLIGTRDSLFDGLAIELQESYVRRTRMEAWTFAKPLLAEIGTEIAELKATVDRIVAGMQEALRRVSTGIDERLKAADGDVKGHLIRFYDPDLVRRVTRTMIVDEAEQRTQTASVRAGLIELLGPNPSFASFAGRLGVGDLVDRIEATAQANAEVAHGTMIVEAKDRILSVSILTKLRERYGNDPQALRAYVAKLVSEAGCFMTVNALEKNRAGPGIPSGAQTLVEKYVVILPKAPDQAAFVEQLKGAFRDAQPGDLEFIESEDRATQITMIAVKNLFPLRYLRILPFLQERYLARVAGNPARFSLELHTEGSLGDYPGLFVKSGEELRRDAGAYLLIAQGLGAIRPGAGGALELHSKDVDGFDNAPQPLGATIFAAIDAVDFATLETLRRTVAERIGAGTDKIALETGVRQAVDDAKPLVNGDVGDPRYRALVESGRAALKLVRG